MPHSVFRTPQAIPTRLCTPFRRLPRPAPTPCPARSPTRRRGAVTFNISLTVTSSSTPPTATGTAVPNPITAGNSVALSATPVSGANPSSTSFTETCNLTAIGGAASVALPSELPGAGGHRGGHLFAALHGHRRSQPLLQFQYQPHRAGAAARLPHHIGDQRTGHLVASRAAFRLPQEAW